MLSARIEHHELLTNIFGAWPSFHDAEVIEFHLWRGEVDPERERWVFPVLTLKLQLWELTDEVGPSGTLITRHHTQATLRFHDVEGLRLEGFDHQNAISGLHIEVVEWHASVPLRYRVEFAPATGFSATFRCTRIEVVAAGPVDA